MPTLHPTSLFRPAFAQGCGMLCADVCNVLNYRILGGGYSGALTHRFFIDYRAFQRCLRASLKGFAASVGSMTKVIKALLRLYVTDDLGHQGCSKV